MTSKQAFYKMRDALIAEGYNNPQNMEDYISVEKDLEASEIVKNKKVNVSAFDVLKTHKEYNDYCDLVGGSKHLTKNEFNLIKEWLENE